MPEPSPPALRLVGGRRHFLFLQGLPGPFFRLLGAELRARGAGVSRINFNGGDALDWNGAGTLGYRGTPADWPEWLAECVAAVGVTDIVVFGDLRPVHLAAHAVADRLGLRFHAFEEGYLRPNHVTLERGGVNGNSSFPRSMRAIQLLNERLLQPEPEIAVPSHFWHRARQSIRYHTVSWFARPWFFHYRTHRHAAPLREMVGWNRRYLLKWREKAASKRAVLELTGRPIFLLPLQLEGDAQLKVHSHFESMLGAVEEVLESFREAPSEVSLLIKRHPLDPDIQGWRRLIERAADRIGVGGRVRFVERFDLMPLLHAARGVVTVNSTAGPLALAAGTPVFVLGDAIYDVPGVTAQGSLTDFWRAPQPVDAGNFEALCRALKAKCLVNGGFHSKEALDLLVAGSADRLLG
jgi:capsular polysaccharide export protein